MNNIIEKLGITKAPWNMEQNRNGFEVWGVMNETCGMRVANCGYAYSFDRSNALLIASAPDMLEALIDSVIESKEESWSDIPWRHFIEIIEKATGKSWSEIKELLV